MSRTKDRAKLHIYLFGGAKGESIVLRLPDGGLAVIDCYEKASTAPKTICASRLLKDRGISTLEFVGLTHPLAAKIA